MRACLSRWLCSVVFLALSGSFSFAAEKNDRVAAELLPPTCVGYVEITQPKRIVELVEKHPLRAKIEAIPEYQKAFETPQYKEFQAVVEEVEKQLGMKLHDSLLTCSGGGIYLGIDSATQGGVLLVRSNDEKVLAKVRDVAVDLVRKEAEKKGEPDPYEVKDYRGLTAYKTKDGIMAVAGPWLVISNKPDLARLVADRYLDGSASTLAANERFVAARKTISGEPAAWAWVDVETVRIAAGLLKLIPAKHENAGAELLAGGLLSVFEKTPYLTASLYAAERELKLAVAAPFDPAWISEQRTYFFGPQAQGVAPPALEAKNTLMSVSLYRDFGGLWQNRDELFGENTLAKLAEADSNLTTLFSGRDFGSEVLAAIEPQFQLIVAQQSFEGQKQVPSVKLPATALVLKLKDPEKVQRALKVQFQSLIGFANIAGAQNKMPLLELESTKEGELQIATAQYLPEVDRPDAAQDGIHFNLTPAMVSTGNWCIISTNKALAMELIEQAKTAKASPSSARGGDNIRVTLNAAAVRQALADNQKHLVAQNMLEKGHDKEEAEKEVNGLLGLLTWFEGASFRLTPEKDTLRVEVVLTAAK